VKYYILSCDKSSILYQHKSEVDNKWWESIDWTHGGYYATTRGGHTYKSYELMAFESREEAEKIINNRKYGTDRDDEVLSEAEVVAMML